MRGGTVTVVLQWSIFAACGLSFVFWSFILLAPTLSVTVIPGGITTLSQMMLSSTVGTVLLYVAIFLSLSISVEMLVLRCTAKSRRLAKRRKELTKQFERYGEKYAAQDREINF